MTCRNTHKDEPRWSDVTVSTDKLYAKKSYPTGTPSRAMRLFLDDEAADMDLFAIGAHIKEVREADYSKAKQQWLEDLKRKEGRI